jgi:protein-S-isoprenylcysteine O-methyltransferase Ste14
MSEKQSSASSNQMILQHVRKAPLLHAVFLDVLGIILVLVGALYTHFHEHSIAGEGVFWVGFVLLIVALILFVWINGKPSMAKA